jgi:hypothetical protein
MAINELRASVAAEGVDSPMAQAGLVVTEPPAEPTSLGAGRADRLARWCLRCLKGRIPSNWRFRLDRRLTHRQWRNIERMMEGDALRHEYADAAHELNHRWNFLSDRIAEHVDEKLLKKARRYKIEVPTHGSRESGGNDYWRISKFSDSWLMTYNGRARVIKGIRETWRWRLQMGAAGAAILGLVMNVGPAWSFVKGFVSKWLGSFTR